MIVDFPSFSITAVTCTDKGRELLGNVSSESWEGHRWVDDNWIGSLCVESSVIFGRWHRLEDSWRFTLDAEYNEQPNLWVGQKVTLIDGFWGERVELVIDKTVPWQEVVFKETEKRTHEHCFFCWASVSEMENTKHMLANHREPVCLECFERFVRGRSFQFIQYPKEL